MHTGKYCPLCFKGFGSEEKNLVLIKDQIKKVLVRRLKDLNPKAHLSCWNQRRLTDEQIAERVLSSKDYALSSRKTSKVIPASATG